MILFFVRGKFEAYFPNEWPAIITQLQTLGADRLDVRVRDWIIVTDERGRIAWDVRADGKA